MEHTPEEETLLRDAFKAVSEMGFVGALSFAPSVTHDSRGNSVGYHKLIHAGLTVAGNEDPVDLSRIDPPGIMNAKSNAQLEQEFEEGFVAAMPSMIEASQNWASVQRRIAGDDSKLIGEGQ